MAFIKKEGSNSLNKITDLGNLNSAHNIMSRPVTINIYLFIILSYYSQ